MTLTRRLPLLPILLLAPAAWAQSSVQLSGILDLAIRQVSNEGAGSMKSMVSGSNSTSRIAVTGREDLGSGLSAGFHLEHGINADTGAPASSTKMWDRRTTVSLISKDWGEVRLGRDFVPSYTAWSRHDPFAYVGVARSANFVSATPTGAIRAAFGTAANTTVRADNGLQWIFPAGLGGFEGGIMVAPGEGGAVASGLAKITALRVGYTAKTWHLTAASTRSENSLTGSSRFTDNVLGGGATVAGVRVSAAWREFKIAQASQVMTMLAAQYNTGPHEFKGSYIRSNAKGRVGTTSIDANDATQLGLGYVYSLSRRSALYGSIATISNDGQARYLISDGPSTVAAGGTSRGVEIGIRHRF